MQHKSAIKHYLEKYKRYPFKFYDKEGKEIKLLFTEKEHEEFIKEIEMIEEIVVLKHYILMVYGFDVDIRAARGNGKLEVILENLEKIEKELRKK